jgi:clumping factor A
MNAKTNKPDAATSDQEAESQASTNVETTTKPQKKKESGLSPELAELVSELREAVKRIDPRKHTPKSLKRALLLAKDVIADIDRLTAL